MDLSFVIAAHNSSAVIGNTLERVRERLSGMDAEVIVVENGSTDNTVALLEAIASDWPADAVKLRVTHSEKGLGNALKHGIAASEGDRVLFTADDLPFGFDDLDAAEKLGFPSDTIIIGSKAHQDSQLERSALRSLMTFTFLSLRRAALGMRVGDPQGTYILPGPWSRHMMNAMREDGYLFTTELALAAERAGVPIVEVPVRLAPTYHSSRIRPVDVKRMILGTFKLRKRRKELTAAGLAARNAQPQAVPAGEGER